VEDAMAKLSSKITVKKPWFKAKVLVRNTTNQRKEIVERLLLRS